MWSDAPVFGVGTILPWCFSLNMVAIFSQLNSAQMSEYQRKEGTERKTDSDAKKTCVGVLVQEVIVSMLWSYPNNLCSLFYRVWVILSASQFVLQIWCKLRFNQYESSSFPFSSYPISICLLWPVPILAFSFYIWGKWGRVFWTQATPEVLTTQRPNYQLLFFFFFLLPSSPPSSFSFSFFLWSESGRNLGSQFPITIPLA